MVSVKWLPDAKTDLIRLYEFIEPHSKDAAARAVLTLVEAASSVQEFPEQGHLWEPDISFRELPVRFASKGYVIRYRLEGDLVIVVRVWHALENR